MTLARRLLRASVVLAVLGAGSPAAVRAAPAKPWRVAKETAHFRIAVHASDALETAMVDEVAGWLETSWKAFHDAGFRAPASEDNASRKSIVVLSDFARLGLPHASGVFRSSTKRIGLNVASYRRLLEAAHGGVPALKSTAPHELFHAIQASYDPYEERWLKEATATAASWAVHPDAKKCVESERIFLRSMSTSLHAMGRSTGREESDLTAKHAYGASLYFRWLGRTPAGTTERLRALWDAAGANPGASALASIGAMLDDAKALGPNFRASYDRFAVACLLRDRLPEAAALPDAALFASTRPPVVDLSERVARLLRTAAKEGAGKDAIDTTAHLAGLGPKYVKLLSADSRPEGLPKDLALKVTLEAGPEEASVQAVVRKEAGWATLRGAHDAKEGVHAVATGPVASATGAVVAVLVRYAEDTSPRDHRLRITAMREEVWEMDPQWFADRMKELEAQKKDPKVADDPMAVLGIGIAEGVLRSLRSVTITLRSDDTMLLSAGFGGVEGTWSRDERTDHVTLVPLRGVGGAEVEDAGVPVPFAREGDARVLSHEGQSVRFRLRAPK